MKLASKLTLSILALGSLSCSSPSSLGLLQNAMSGAWGSEDGKTLLLIDGNQCIQAQGSAQMLFELRYGAARALRTQLHLRQEVPGGLEMDGESLILANPVAGQDQLFKRLETTPVELDIEPFAMGLRPASQASCHRIAESLLPREKGSQHLRRKIEERMESARLSGLLNSFEEQMEFMASSKMVALRDRLVAGDAANTRFIGNLLRSNGWITKLHYGQEAQLAAFNMVRFSGNLQLMRSVLPALKEELKSDGGLGYLYTLLYDTVELSMGGKQLYGTLLLPDLDGRMRLRRVARKGSLDQRRLQMGLPPIREFLANFEQQFGMIEVED